MVVMQMNAVNKCKLAQLSCVQTRWIQHHWKGCLMSVNHYFIAYNLCAAFHQGGLSGVWFVDGETEAWSCSVTSSRAHTRAATLAAPLPLLSPSHRAGALSCAGDVS